MRWFLIVAFLLVGCGEEDTYCLQEKPQSSPTKALPPKGVKLKPKENVGDRHSQWEYVPCEELEEEDEDAPTPSR